VLDTNGEDIGWRQTKVENLPAGEAVSMTAAELHKILYSTESLRKISDFD
jgi:tRNA (guanine-N(7)-)-methyltransferase subunit TRM82